MWNELDIFEDSYLNNALKELNKVKRTNKSLTITIVGLIIAVAYVYRKFDEKTYNLEVRIKNLENDKEE